MNSIIGAVNSSVDLVVGYLQKNAIAIACLLGVVYLYKNQGKSTSMGRGQVLASETTDKTSSRSMSFSSGDRRDDDLRQVRLRQQELASERAIQAAKERKEKEAKEKQRKNGVSKKQTKTEKPKLTADACAYSPMQPWSAGTGGYRPQRRSTRRG